MNSPFVVFSWQRAFLPDLKSWLLEQTGGKPGKVLIIVPNRRPWRYFQELFAADKKVVMLPKMLPFDSIVSIWRKHAESRMLTQANLLDQVALAWDCVKSLSDTDPLLAARLAEMDIERFLPWGIRLAKLLEDILSQGLEARDIAAPEGDVEEFAASLLQSLGRISHLWKTILPGNGFTTSGLDCHIASRHAGSIPPFLQPAPDRPVLIAGFSTLNGVQEKLFRSLWDAGAIICLHGDPQLALRDNPPHWACAGQAAWIEKWHATPELVTPPGDSKPEFHFYAGYDSHSQLQKMTEDLRMADASAAIVLQDNALLMPVLHHIPDKNVNISMGYPLSRTPLHSLLSEIFDALLRKRPEGNFYWRDIQKLIQHPLLGMLGQSEEASLRPATICLDTCLRNGAKFVNIRELETQCAGELTTTQAELLRKCIENLLEKPESARTTAALAMALADICDFLQQNGSAAFEKFPLDEEALARLRDTVIPMLAMNTLAHQQFDLAALHSLLSMLLEQERIPFEADPLVGTQILGMLETRLLHFNELFILDASDDLLPGQSAQDPLLPDNLRGLIGLQDTRSRQLVVAYNLFRLCQGAEKVHFYWTEGSAPSRMESARRYRSRFVERLIWNLEQERNMLLEPRDGPLMAATSRATLHLRSPAPISRNKALSCKLATLLKKGVSAALINDYLACPLKFAKKRLLLLSPLPEVKETDDPVILGNCIHNTLRDLLHPYVGRHPFEDPNCQKISANIENCLSAQIAGLELASRLPISSFLYFDTVAPQILRRYIQAQKKANTHTLIVDLEKELNARILLGDREYKISGRVDRIDERDGIRLILDYKTGSPKTVRYELWQDEGFFADMREASLNPENLAANGEILLNTLRNYLQDAQLPLYMLLAEATGLKAANAAFVYLCEAGTEKTIFDKDADIDDAMEKCEILISFLLRHLECCSQFNPVTENCRWCEYQTFCGV